MKVTVAQALAWMAPILGLKYPQHREEILVNLNRFRAFLYSEFDEFRLFEYQQCIRLGKFKMDCGSDSCNTYFGFTLPPDMSSLSAVWQHNDSAILRSRWREVHTGLLMQGDGDMQTVPIVGEFATEREVTPGRSLQIYTDSIQDNGKEVWVTAIMADGSEKRLCFTLVSGKHAVVAEPVCSIISVVTPADQCGMLTLSEKDGRCLSMYEPGSQVRSYSRYKLITHCPSNCILIRGYREYRPVCDDFDIVEVGDQLAIEHAAGYFKYYRSKNQDEMVKGARDKAEMMRRVKSIVKRQEGRSQQDGADIGKNAPRRRRRGLPGYKTTTTTTRCSRR